MTPEDQVAALLARANPVASLDLLDPIESVDVDSPWDRSERETTVLKEARVWGPGGPWLAQAMAMVAIIVVVAIPVLISVTAPDSTADEPTPLSTPAEHTAIAFMNALNEYDGLAIRGMWAVEDRNDFNPDGWPTVTEFYRTLGVLYTDVECVELKPTSLPDGTAVTPVDCSFTHRQDLMDALGLEDSQGAYTVYISDDTIVRTFERYHSLTSMNESYDEFQSWVQATHPDDVQTMYVDVAKTPYAYHWYYANLARDPAALAPNSLELWEQYVDEFVAEMGG